MKKKSENLPSKFLLAMYSERLMRVEKQIARLDKIVEGLAYTVDRLIHIKVTNNMELISFMYDQDGK